MKCPFCHAENDRVVDSRACHNGYVIRRRRECLFCNRRFTTHERMEELTIKVIKKDGTRVPFEREKIQRGLERACWKRSVTDEQISSIVTAIEQKIHSCFETEVHSQELGELVMSHLGDLDQVAFVRFASVYRDFSDAQDFMKELAPMLKPGRKLPPKEA